MLDPYLLVGVIAGFWLPAMMGILLDAARETRRLRRDRRIARRRRARAIRRTLAERRTRHMAARQIAALHALADRTWAASGRQPRASLSYAV
jgi:hypothetical protein